MHKKRLLKLADLLEKDAKNKKGIKFNLRAWALVADGKKPMSCGTQACAMGLAALSGAFKRQGLTMGWNYIPTIRNGKTHWYEMRGFDAAAVLFEIDYGLAEWLFSARYYRGIPTTGATSERAVAKRIRAVVAGKAKYPQWLAESLGNA